MLALIDALLQQPPAALDRLRRRIAPHPLEDVRRATVDRIMVGQLSESQTDALPLLFRVMGAGAERPRLERLLLDSAAPHAHRSMALAALFHELAAQPLIDRMDPAVRIGLGDAWIRPLVRLAAKDLEAGETLADMLLRAQPASRAHLLRQFERLRRQLGASAMAVYDRALLRPDLAEWWPRIMEHLLMGGSEIAPTTASNVIPFRIKPP